MMFLERCYVKGKGLLLFGLKLILFFVIVYVWIYLLRWMFSIEYVYGNVWLDEEEEIKINEFIIVVVSFFLVLRLGIVVVCCMYMCG